MLLGEAWIGPAKLAEVRLHSRRAICGFFIFIELYFPDSAWQSVAM